MNRRKQLDQWAITTPKKFDETRMHPLIRLQLIASRSYKAKLDPEYVKAYESLMLKNPRFEKMK